MQFGCDGDEVVQGGMVEFHLGGSGVNTSLGNERSGHADILRWAGAGDELEVGGLGALCSGFILDLDLTALARGNPTGTAVRDDFEGDRSG